MRRLRRSCGRRRCRSATPMADTRRSRSALPLARSAPASKRSLRIRPLGTIPTSPRRSRSGACGFSTLICLTRSGMHPHLSGKYGRDLSVTVSNTTVSLLVDGVAAAMQAEREFHGDPFKPRSDKDEMQLSFRRGWSGAQAAPPGKTSLARPLNGSFARLSPPLSPFRRGDLARRRCRRARLADQAQGGTGRSRAKEEARRGTAAPHPAGKARAGTRRSSVGSSAALEQARQIRTYPDVVGCANDAAPDPMSSEDLASWSAWALEQAARIDPVLSSAYKTRPVESDE